MKARALWLWAPWALFAALATGWVVYWHVLADGAQKRVMDWVAAQNAEGAHASVSHIIRHGFPVLLRLELRGAQYAPAEGGWSAASDRLDLHVDMLNPQHAIFEAKAPIRIQRDDGAVTNVAADALIASIRTQGGALAVAGFEADNLQIDDPAKEGVLLAHKVVLNARPDPRTEGDYQVALDIQQMVLPRAVRSFESFGLDVASLRAAVVVSHGEALTNASRQDPLGPWREAGGSLHFDAVTLHWGPLQTTGRGEGALDAERRLHGHLEFPIEHPAPVLTAIANGPNVERDAKRALALLAAGYAISGDDLTIDVDAQDGLLRLEGLPVRPLPPVY